MKRSILAQAVAVAAAGVLVAAAVPAFAGEDFCPMGGMLIKAQVDKEKAVEWSKDYRKAVVANEDSDDWSVLTLSKTDDDIAIVVRAGSVFFGVAGKGKAEVDARLAEKAFGRDLRDLPEAIRKDLEALRKAGGVAIEGSDVDNLAKAAALGTFEKARRDWELTKQDCTGTDVDTSGL
ncbi:MAG TPA: hypothetical protein VI078_16810 [bacterium]